MLFGVVFKKEKTKAGSEKNVLRNISTLGALQNIIETDLGSYSAGIPFSSFYDFRQQVM